MGKMKLRGRHEKRSILRKPTDAGNSDTAHADGGALHKRSVSFFCSWRKHEM